jgi:hypothetical protein
MAKEVLDDKPDVANSSPAKSATVSSQDTGDKPLSEMIGDVIKKHTDAETEEETVPPTEEGEARTPIEEEPEEDEAEPEKEKTEGEDDEEGETEKLPFNDHPRWKQVLKERKDLKAKLEEANPLAETARGLQRFCQENNVSQDELTDALQLAALAKRDVTAFRRVMQERLEGFDIALGTKLPADLQKKVDDGKIDEDGAKEIAQARIQAKHAQNGQQSAQQIAEQRLHRDIGVAVDAWEASLKKGDPSWDSRRDTLQDRFLALCRENPPRNVQEAIQLAEKANTEVKKRFSKFAPKPQKRKVLSSTGSSTNKGEELNLDSLDNMTDFVKRVAARHRA